jgi:hypothetical protein
MSKRTPGPWTVSRETTRGQFVTETHIRGPRNDHIALVGPCEIDANARLIAAAPELLGALRELTNAVEQYAPNPGNWPELARALAVIAKAEGGAA